MSSFGSWEDETLGSMNAEFVSEDDFEYKGYGINVGIIEPFWLFAKNTRSSRNGK